MSGTTIALLVIAAMVLSVGFIACGVALTLAMGIYSHIQTTNMAAEEWREVAEQLGLAFEEGNFVYSPKLKGKLRGAPVEVYRKRTRLGPESSTRTLRWLAKRTELRTVFAVELPPPWRGDFYITTNDKMTAAVFSALGSENYHTGDETFDEALRVRGAIAPPVAAGLARDDVRRTLLVLSDEFLFFQLVGGTLEVHVSHPGDDVEEMIDHIETVVDAAAVLATASTTAPHPNPATLSSQTAHRG